MSERDETRTEIRNTLANLVEADTLTTQDGQARFTGTAHEQLTVAIARAVLVLLDESQS